jgi:hypothetical protein
MSARLVFTDEITARIGVSYTVLLGYVKRGVLAQPKVISGRLAWTEEDVTQFIASLPRVHPRGRGRPRGVKNGQGRGKGNGYAMENLP